MFQKEYIVLVVHFIEDKTPTVDISYKGNIFESSVSFSRGILNMIAIIFIFSSLFGAVVQDLIRKCPPSEDIPDCTCQQAISFRMHCKNLYNPHSLKAISNKLSKYAVYQLRLDDSFLMYWPKEMFTHLHIKELEMYNSEVLGLESSNGTEMFQGLENSLKRLYFYNVKGMTTWGWSAFKFLKDLKTFIIRRGDLVAVNEEFSSISPESLTTVNLAYNKIEYIHHHAFAYLVALEEWELEGNRIVNINRTMLPNPANQLVTIKLHENKIVTIPNDFFTEMPKLKQVYLWGNKILFLEEEMFQSIQNGNPFLLDVRDNRLFCCESLKFLLNKTYQEYINGACAKPLDLYGKDIRSLTKADLSHGLC